MEIFIIIKLLHIFLFLNFYILDFLQKSKIKNQKTINVLFVFYPH